MGINSNRVEHFSDPSCPEATVTMPPPLELHRVCLPPHKTTLQKFRDRVSEIFFPDDPLHRFKNQTWIRKLVLGLQFFFPVFQWGPSYGLNLLRSDIISGLTIASLAIPQGISYAKLANLPPIIGLYSSFVPPLIYSVLGSSRHLGVGPVSIASLVMGTMLSETVSYSEQPILYLQLAFTATFFAGVFQASLGLLRLGFIIDFLSKATLVGFMAGAAIIVSLQQLKGLLGIVHFTSKMQIVPVLLSVFRQKNEWSWQTIVMGTSFLVFLLTTRKISMRKPKLFWISAAAPLTSVILSTILVYLLRSKLHGVSTIGHLPKGLNPPSSNMLYSSRPLFGGCDKNQPYNRNTLPHRIAVGRTFAALKNYQVDGNKEMMAIGLMNMAGSCSSCYVTTGSFSRSAVNYNAGAQTVVSNVIMAATVLAAIRLWKVDKLDFVACLCSFLGVLFISVPLGLAIAVGVSVFKILLHVTRPNTVVLGNIPGTQIYQNLSRYREASRVPSFLILAVESPIYFANSTYLQERILRWVREEEERVDSNKESAMKCIILDMTGNHIVTDVLGFKFSESFGEAVADISSPWKAYP
ncbi:sulfate transporter 3;4 [Actinidia rufa]|uniref:Sulfate transporter 34 n=1 Tax=Actinidia rufa TaxID=165716 RepID=A0A7J0FZL4_9ERIC|nr:sulfate transporter 3;4 [Actinidia rufa]